MNNDEISNWLIENGDKTDDEMRSFLQDEIKSGKRNFWDKYYFFSRIKKSPVKFPERVRKLLDSEEKSNKRIRIRWGGLIIAGMIFTYSAQFKDSPLDEVVIAAVAVTAGILYYRLKPKMDAEISKSIAAAVVLLLSAAMVIGMITTIT